MSVTGVIILSDLITLMIAVGFNAVIIGVRWGEMRRDIVTLREDIHEIKAMFTLKLRE